MELKSMTLFQAVKKRMDWLAQRQEVLSQNIANADTPKYRARDLKSYNFIELIRRENTQLNMKVGSDEHLPGRRKRIRDFAEYKDQRPFETSPRGNSVVLEEQMMKVAETQIDYQMMTSIYKKNIGFIKLAIGKRR